MTQATPLIGSNQSGLAYRTADNDAKKALLNHHKGSTAPSYAEAGIIWLDDTATPWKLKIYDGADWIVIGAVNSNANTLEIYHGAAGLRVLNHATDTGTANAYAVAPAPPITAYATGQIVTLKPANNQTGACTIAVNGLTAKNIKTLAGADPASGTLSTTGIYALMYDGTNFVILNPNVTAALIGAAALSSAQTFTGAQRGAYSTLTDGATITPDFSLANNFKVQLGGNRTLANPSNLAAYVGQSFKIDVYQDATGSRTLALAWMYSPPGGTAPVLSTAGGTKDTLYGDVAMYANSTVTMTIASPCVVTWNSHGFYTGQKLQLTTTSALPTGLSASTTYYVIQDTANTFKLATSLANAAAGTAINTSGSQSGTHTAEAGSIPVNLVKGLA